MRIRTFFHHFAWAALLLPVAATARSEEHRLTLVPIVNDERLEYIQENKAGTRVLTHDRGFAPRLWEAKSMRQIATLNAEGQGMVFEAHFSEDGNYVVTSAHDRIRVWNANSLELVGTWKSEDFGKDTVFTVAELSSDNTLLVVGCLDGKVLSADQKPGTKLTQLAALTSPTPMEPRPFVRDIEISSDGTLVAVCGNSKDAILVNRKSPGKLTKIGPHELGIGWIKISPDGAQVLTTGLDLRAGAYDSKTGQLQKAFEHVIGEKGGMPNTMMAALYVGKSLRNILVAGKDGTMSIYDRKTFTKVRDLKGYTSPIREIRVSQDGSSVATYPDAIEFGNDEELLKIWDVESGKQHPFARGALNPTAGEFSPDGKYFLVGYDDGSFRRHELTTGAIRTTTIGSVDIFERVHLIPGDRLVVAQRRGQEFVPQTLRTAIDMRNPSRTDQYFGRDFDFQVSPDGTMVFFPGVLRKEEEVTEVRAVWTVGTGKTIWGFWSDCEGSAWGSRGQCIAWDTKSVALYDLAVPEFKKILADQLTNVWFALLSPDNSVALIFDDNGSYAISTESGKMLWKSDPPGSPFAGSYTISSDSKLAVLSTDSDSKVVNLKTGEVVSKIDIMEGISSGKELNRFCPVSMSNDGRWVIFPQFDHTIFVDAKTGKRSFTLDSDDDALDSARTRISPDGKRYLVNKDRKVSLYDVSGANPRLEATYQLADMVMSITWTTDGSRIVTSDRTNQMSVFSASQFMPASSPKETQSLVRLGRFVTMQDGSWLVMDEEGRYDATDPSDVSGGAYVLRWAGGVEPIDVSQLKALYYEPNLLAKVMGLDKSPKRAVPDLSQIRLYPDIDLKPNSKKSSLIEVSLEPRDNGGIGKVRVFMNGKQIDEKNGVGFFGVDVSKYEAYMLPAARLPEGVGNILSVTATNEKGDLISRPVRLDVGVPTTLKAPEVNLYALCVGVGDYVGTRRDLKAPPSDASELGKALSAVGEGLLPGRVHVTTLTTEGQSRPDRKSILEWFDRTATQATSSDIVLIFFAGHGTSRIGETRGYFFLTADADPSDVTPAILGTSTISSEDLQRELKRIPADKQVIILDTCHSGAAADQLLAEDRSVSGDYARAYEAIKDSAGTWILAGAAADQLSYESINVEHGMLTYALLEGIDQASPNALRQGTNGDLFVDVERWFTYAANRVESLKNEVGVPGIQRPEFKRVLNGTSFDVGAIPKGKKGLVGLKAPKPIVILSTFEDSNDEDPLTLENLLTSSAEKADRIKVWTDVPKHPNVYRISGSYEVKEESVTVKVNVQKFDRQQNRTTKATLEFTSSTKLLKELSEKIWSDVQKKVLDLEGGG